MGADTWIYYVPYEEDINNVLKKLKETVFEKGEFTGSEYNPKTIEDAKKNTETYGGTQSILDIKEVSDEIEMASVSPLERDVLIEIYGTGKPTHEMIDENQDFYDLIDRGEAIYIIVYKNNKPTEIMFAGYSFD